MSVGKRELYTFDVWTDEHSGEYFTGEVYVGGPLCFVRPVSNMTWEVTVPNPSYFKSQAPTEPIYVREEGRKDGRIRWGSTLNIQMYGTLTTSTFDGDLAVTYIANIEFSKLEESPIPQINGTEPVEHPKSYLRPEKVQKKKIKCELHQKVGGYYKGVVNILGQDLDISVLSHNFNKTWLLRLPLEYPGYFKGLLPSQAYEISHDEGLKGAKTLVVTFSGKVAKLGIEFDRPDANSYDYTYLADIEVEFEESLVDTKSSIPVRKGFGEEKCVVCAESLNDRTTLCQLQCLHVFHERCINTWKTYKKNSGLICPYRCDLTDPRCTLVKKNTVRVGGAGVKGSVYTVVRSSVGEPGGRYASKSGPAAAAKKAASKRFGTKRSVRVTIRETGTDREFTYDATRVKLSKPVIRKIGGVTVTREFRVKVVAVKAAKRS